MRAAGRTAGTAVVTQEPQWYRSGTANRIRPRNNYEGILSFITLSDRILADAYISRFSEFIVPLFCTISIH